MPAIAVGGNIYFHALPSGKELEPFVNAITQTARPSPPCLSDIKDFEKITLPAQLELYIALGCGFCPSAVQHLVSLALNCSCIRLSIIDALLFNERSQTHGIRSVPTVLFDDAYRWTGGRFDPQELVDRLVDRDPAGISASSIENMITEGEAGQVAEMMLSHGEIFPAFLELLVHEKWPVRLGAMVAMEIMIEKDIGIAAQAAGFLEEGSKTAKDPVKGDIYYILGQIGDEPLIPALERVLTENPVKEVKEALEEAIERIRERHADPAITAN